MLLSTAARTAQGASVRSTQMDAAEAVAQLRASQQLGQALSDSARQQGALGLDSHGDGSPAWMAHTAAMDPAADGKLPATLNGQDARKAQAGSRTLQDPVEAFARAQLHLDTPSSAALVSAEHLSLFSGQDTTLSTQGDAHLTAAHTLSAVSGQTTSLYTHAGGIHAIAANATLSLRAHTDAQQLWADQGITVQSTTDEVRVFAQDSITLTAGQSQITLQGGDIIFTCPGSFTVKGAVHEWGGGGEGKLTPLNLPAGAVSIAPQDVSIQREYHDDEGTQAARYTAKLGDGGARKGTTDAQGQVELPALPPGPVSMRFEPDGRSYQGKDVAKNERDEQNVDALFARHITATSQQGGQA